jgi:hypothetical protein
MERGAGRGELRAEGRGHLDALAAAVGGWWC